MLKQYIKNKIKGNTVIKPSLIIPGAMKGGTTALYRYLTKHPNIVSSPVKEVNYFGCDDRYAKGDQFYHNYFTYSKRQYPQAKLSFEACPHYLVSAHKSAERIKRYNPEMKIVIILRDPIQRAYSAWSMYSNRVLVEGREDYYREWMNYCECKETSKYVTRDITEYEDFDKAIKKEIELLEKGQEPEGPLLKYGLYFDQTKIFLDNFQPLIFKNEDLLADTQGHLSKILEYIGMEDYKWNDLRPTFTGKYDTISMSKYTEDFMKEFYRESNDKLSNLIGQEINW